MRRGKNRGGRGADLLNSLRGVSRGTGGEREMRGRKRKEKSETDEGEKEKGREPDRQPD